MKDFMPSCWDTDVIQEHSLSTLSMLNILGCVLQGTQPVMPSIIFSSTRTYLISFHLLIVCICLRSEGIGTLFWNCCISSTIDWHIQSRCLVNTYWMLNEFSLPPWAALHNCGCWEKVSLECAMLTSRFFQAENNEGPTNSGKVFFNSPFLPKEILLEKPGSGRNPEHIYLSTYEWSVTAREGPSKSLFYQIPFVT